MTNQQEEVFSGLNDVREHLIQKHDFEGADKLRALLRLHSQKQLPNPMTKTESEYARGVMLEAENGTQVQITLRGLDDWTDTNNPSWNWHAFTYRIKPTPPKPRELWVNVWTENRAGYVGRAYADPTNASVNRVLGTTAVHFREVLP